MKTIVRCAIIIIVCLALLTGCQKKSNTISREDYVAYFEETKKESNKQNNYEITVEYKRTSTGNPDTVSSQKVQKTGDVIFERFIYTNVLGKKVMTEKYYAKKPDGCLLFTRSGEEYEKQSITDKTYETMKENLSLAYLMSFVPTVGAQEYLSYSRTENGSTVLIEAGGETERDGFYLSGVINLSIEDGLITSAYVKQYVKDLSGETEQVEETLMTITYGIDPLVLPEE